MQLTIQQIIAAFLAAQGQHKEAAEVLASDNRGTWLRLGEHAIRTAPEYNRTHVAHSIRYALDRPENGGGGTAADFILKPEAHPMLEGVTLYRAWRINDDRTLADTGFVSEDTEALKRRVVGLYAVRAIVVGQQ